MALPGAQGLAPFKQSAVIAVLQSHYMRHLDPLGCLAAQFISKVPWSNALAALLSFDNAPRSVLLAFCLAILCRWSARAS
jgi:hypothetical protein